MPSQNDLFTHNSHDEEDVLSETRIILRAVDSEGSI